MIFQRFTEVIDPLEVIILTILLTIACACMRIADDSINYDGNVELFWLGYGASSVISGVLLWKFLMHSFLPSDIVILMLLYGFLIFLGGRFWLAKKITKAIFDSIEL